MSNYKVGDKVRLTGGNWDLRNPKRELGGVGSVVTVDRINDFTGNGYAGPWDLDYGPGWETELAESSDPKRAALDAVFEGLGDLIEPEYIREGDVYAKQYEDGSFSTWSKLHPTRGSVGSVRFRLIHRPEPEKIEAPTKLGAVVLYGELHVVRGKNGFKSELGTAWSDEEISARLTEGEAKVIFEGVDDE